MATVLVVDDSNYTRRVHTRMLESNGHKVLEQSTGMGAIEVFSLERPDVVLLDLSMEDLGGIQVLKTMRELDPKARVIVISADVQKTTERMAMDAGAARFMGKPASEQSLLTAVAELVA